MDVNQFSPLEMAAFINSMKADDSFNRRLDEFVQSHQSVESDTHVVSVSNSEVQTSPGESIYIPETIVVGEINHSSVTEKGQQKGFPDSVEQSTQSSKGESLKSVVVANPVNKTVGKQEQEIAKLNDLLINRRRYYSLNEVANYFGVGASTMHKYRKDGNVIGFLLGGKWQFTKEQVEDFEMRLTTGQISK